MGREGSVHARGSRALGVTRGAVPVGDPPSGQLLCHADCPSPPGTHLARSMGGRKDLGMDPHVSGGTSADSCWGSGDTCRAPSVFGRGRSQPRVWQFPRFPQSLTPCPLVLPGHLPLPSHVPRWAPRASSTLRKPPGPQALAAGSPRGFPALRCKGTC